MELQHLWQRIRDGTQNVLLPVHIVRTNNKKGTFDDTLFTTLIMSIDAVMAMRLANEVLTFDMDFLSNQEESYATTIWGNPFQNN